MNICISSDCCSGGRVIDDDPVLEQIADQRLVVRLRGIGVEPLAGLQHALDISTLDDDFLDPSLLHVRQ